jgi:acyl-lipid omega-6 desaturase (Delta-12 desaturase)
MSHAAAALPATTDLDARSWARSLRPYGEPSRLRSVWELTLTAVPLAALWALMQTAVHYDQFWLGAALLVPAAGLLVRLFLIQHDCGHGSFFAWRWLNDWVGRILGVFTLTAYDDWRRSHALHHAGSGNLDRRGIGDIDTLTVREYRALTPGGRLRYRLYRHPLVMFGLGPAYQFLLRNRLPATHSWAEWRPWMTTMATNAAIAGLFVSLMWAVGVVDFLIIHLSVTLLAASIGVWLFYVQHQFEETLWAKGEAWDRHDAALHGSSHYDLPPVLRWFTANIGVHHVHHLCSRIPFYRLGQVLRDHPELRNVSRLTLWESLRCVRLVLWDEDEKRLISFRELNARSA